MAEHEAPEHPPVAVLGSNRIPFARSNGPYAKASNQDMLTAALDGLIERTGIAGERLGEVAGGAVLKHSRDFNLTRESLLGTRLSPETPAYDVGQACGTGLETAILVANKIALGQVDSAIACGVDTTSDAPIALNDDLREILLEANNAALEPRPDASRCSKVRPGHIVPEIPRNAEPRTGLSMGEHTAIMAKEWGITRDAQDELAAASPPAPRRRLRRAASRTTSSRPYLGPRARPEPAPRLHRREARQAEAGLRRPGRDDDRRQLDAAQRRRLRGAARHRGVGGRARPDGRSPASSTPRPPRSTTSAAARAC